jgi:pimeloyl-ACP methyl ester carboxylesterase
MLSRQQKKVLGTIGKFILPIIAVFIVLMASLAVKTVGALTTPPRTKYTVSLADYELIGKTITKQDVTWSLKGGGEGTGWFFQGPKGAPLIVLSHSYGQNMVDQISLAVLLYDTGYNVLLYDLRGHGESKIEKTSLGDDEVDDLLSAIEHMKTLKDATGEPLINKDQIGLFGVSLGAYASLVAASKDPSVKAVVVDAVYPDVPRYMEIKVKAFSSFTNPLLLYFVDLGMKFNFSKYGTTSGQNSLSGLTNTKQLYILGKDTKDLQISTNDLFNQAVGQKQSVEVPKSRISILYKADQDVYDPVVQTFFLDAMPPKVDLPVPDASASTETPNPSNATPTPTAEKK